MIHIDPPYTLRERATIGLMVLATAALALYIGWHAPMAMFEQSLQDDTKALHRCVDKENVLHKEWRGCEEIYKRVMADLK